MTVDCKTTGCAGRIDWATTVPGAAPMPVNHDSAGKPGGDLAVWRNGPKLMCRVLRAGETPGAGEIWGANHWGTCTKADDHKTAKAETRAAAGWTYSRRHHRAEYRTRAGSAEPDHFIAADALLDWSAAELSTWLEAGGMPDPAAELFTEARRHVATYDAAQQQVLDVIDQAHAGEGS